MTLFDELTHYAHYKNTPRLASEDEQRKLEEDTAKAYAAVWTEWVKLKPVREE